MTTPVMQMQTVTSAKGVPPCVECNESLTYLKDKNSWRCLSCRPLEEGEDYEFVTSAPICKTQICKKPSSRLEVRGNWRCLECSPWPKDTSAPDQNPHKYVDIKPDETRVVEIIKEQIGSAKATILTEEQIREIVQDELANWHIQRPSVTADEVAEITSTNTVPVEPKVETFLQKAKRLGIQTHYKVNGVMAGGMRKKADILAEIEARETKESTSVDETTDPQG